MTRILRDGDASAISRIPSMRTIHDLYELKDQIVDWTANIVQHYGLELRWYRHRLNALEPILKEIIELYYVYSNEEDTSQYIRLSECYIMALEDLEDYLKGVRKELRRGYPWRPENAFFLLI